MRRLNGSAYEKAKGKNQKAKVIRKASRRYFLCATQGRAAALQRPAKPSESLLPFDFCLLPFAFSSHRFTLHDDAEALRQFAMHALEEGVQIVPDGRFYTSAVHTERDIDETIERLGV